MQSQICSRRLCCCRRLACCARMHAHRPRHRCMRTCWQAAGPGGTFSALNACVLKPGGMKQRMMMVHQFCEGVSTWIHGSRMGQRAEDSRRLQWSTKNRLPCRVGCAVHKSKHQRPSEEAQPAHHRPVRGVPPHAPAVAHPPIGDGWPRHRRAACREGPFREASSTGSSSPIMPSRGHASGGKGPLQQSAEGDGTWHAEVQGKSRVNIKAQPKEPASQRHGCQA